MERRLHASTPQPRFWRVSLVGLELVIRAGAEGIPGTVNKIPCKSPEAAQAQRAARRGDDDDRYDDVAE